MSIFVGVNSFPRSKIEAICFVEHYVYRDWWDGTKIEVRAKKEGKPEGEKENAAI